MPDKRRRFSISLSALSVISITAASAVAVAICIVIFVSVYNNAIFRDAEVTSAQSVVQTTLAINNYLDSMKDKLTKINETVKESSDIKRLENEISAVTRFHNDIYAVLVYDKDGNIISCTGNGAERKNKVYKDLSFNKELFDSTEDFAVSNPHVQTLFKGEYPWVVTLSVKTGESVFGGGAYIAIDFKFSEIAKYIDNVGIGRHGYCFITDSAGNIIYHPQQQLIFSGLKTESTDFIKSLADGSHSEKNVIYTLDTTNDKLWRIVGVNYTDELTAERSAQIIKSIVMSFMFCTAFALIVLFTYSKIVNAPVRSLARAMKAFEGGTDNFKFSGGNDIVTELSVLSGTFEHMEKTIQTLMEQVRAEETELRKTELQALQAQINPHFLYNTLDSIQWMCEQDKTAEASEMVGALAKLFRISISRGHELIPIKDELQHAESYLIIQSFRYRNQFSYSFHTDSSLEGYLCNKITIQPLIENAIYHGIDRMVDRGEIKITVKQAEDCEDDILITVSDNGVGMTEEQCAKILQKARSDRGGIGVKNVNDRLKIYFGEKYGLSIESELDKGTAVTVRIPKIDKETANEL